MITDTYALYSERTDLPNIDTSHRCILQCPLCTRQKIWGPKQIKRGRDMPEEDLIKILNFFPGVDFCGQISDPIYHPHFLTFLKIIEEYNKVATVRTNGTGKTLEWWKEAFSYSKEKIRWVFGVDGIDHKSEIYRIGSDFENVWKMMQLGQSLGNIIVWQYIVFDYNEKDLPKAIEIAFKEGFTLDVIHSNRKFNSKNLRLKQNINHQPSDTYIEEVNKITYRYNETPNHKQWCKIRDGKI